MNKVVNSWFFTSFQNCIGIIKVKDDYGNEKFYIDVASGLDEELDIEAIANRGTPFYPNAIK